MCRVVVTGGAGYVGHRLGLALAGKGYQVTLMDLNPPLDSLPEGVVTWAAGDVRHMESLRCFQGAAVVFHVASYGMSGRQSLQHRLIQENVIEACILYGVGRLVYTSTYNTVFGGQAIACGDETLPLFPAHRHPDSYSRTKTLAEQVVLGANSRPLAAPASGCLRTCAIRPAGIYGPGEQRHLPRIIRALEMGLFRFVYGSPNSLVDFVHVNNLVTAHILAAEALTAKRGFVASGQAYYDNPINNFEFFRPLVEGLGYPMPKLRLPLWLVFYAAFLIELLHAAVWRVYNFQPLLTRAEVYKTGVTHYFSMSKARRELGYEPEQLPFKPVVPQLLANYRNKSAEALSPYFLAEWLLGDTCNLVGALLKGDQVPTVVFTAQYFICMDVVLLVQFIYYTTLQRRRERLLSRRHSRHHRHRHRHRQHALPQGAVVSAEQHPQPQQQHQQPSAAGSSGGSGVPLEEQPLVLSHGEADFMVGSGDTVNGIGRDFVFRPQRVLASVGAVFLLTGLLHHQQQQQQQGLPGFSLDEGDGYPSRRLLVVGSVVPDIIFKMPSWAQHAGTVIAYCSSILYLTSRISQITKNWRRRSAEGLALTMFLFAMAANTLYGFSILVRAYSLASLQSSAPWLVGSLGTVALDTTIFMQGLMYGTDKKHGSDEEEALLPGDDGKT
ncbi:hypothetical protein N2152v2_007557 [Parachlorella kessleri]